MVVVHLNENEIKFLIDSIYCNEYYGRLREDEKLILHDVEQILKEAEFEAKRGSN